MNTSRCKIPGQFSFVSLGDVHLGHSSTPTAHTLKALKQCLSDEVIKRVDMVIITGDLFDHLLHAEEDELYLIHRWMTILLMRCAVHGTMLEVVEGTPRHDRHQSRYFVEQKHNADIPVQLHYATELSIRYIEHLDAHFLYVPDKCRPHTDQILEEVRLQMKALGIDKLDMAIMHGAFEYQLPEVVTEPTHNSDIYLGLVKHYILIGHVHNQTQRDRILAAGSFDRHTHGDEIPKGYYEVVVRDSGKDSITFIENKRAKRYDTINCHGLDTKQLNVLIREKVATLPRGSSIRLSCNQHDAATGDLKLLRQEYPQFEWAPVKVEKQDKPKQNVADTLATFDLSEYIPIDKQSVMGLIEPDLQKFANGSEATVSRCRLLLAEML